MPKTTRVLTKKHLARIEKERRQKRYLFLSISIIGVLVFGIILYGYLDNAIFQLNRAVAQVGDKSIKLSELQSQVRFDRWQLIRQYESTYQTKMMFGNDPSFGSYFDQELQQIQIQLTNSDSIATQAVDELIQNIILEREASSRGIKVSDQEVEESFQQAFGYYANPTATPTVTPRPVFTSTYSPTQLALVTLTPTPTLEPTSTPTPATITATPTEISTPTPIPSITPTPTPYTYDGYRLEVQKLLDGLKNAKLSETELRTIVKAGVIYKKVNEALTADIKSEQEQVWARHILVSDEVKAKEIINRIKTGQDFATLAVELSVDTSNNQSGGDLGWFSRSKMVAEFEAVAFSMKVGELTAEPVKSSFGFHIIQVLGHEVRTLSGEELSSAKSDFFQKWLTEAKNGKDIQKYEDTWKNKIPKEPTLPPELQG